MKNIYRLENINNSKKIKVEKGYLIFICSHSSYYAKPKVGCISENFSLEDNIIHKSGEKEWEDNCEKNVRVKNRKKLDIANSYNFQYEQYGKIGDSEFKMLILEVIPIQKQIKTN